MAPPMPTNHASRVISPISAAQVWSKRGVRANGNNKLKPLPKPLQRVLDAALDALEPQAVFKKDKARVKQTCCSPAKFGLPEPITEN